MSECGPSPESASDVVLPPPLAPDPEHAWRALTLVNDWLRHAEAKLGVSLGVAGVSGGVLFSLVQDRTRTVTFDVAAVICTLGILIAGVCAVVGLYPVLGQDRRMPKPEDAVNPLFFHDIARAYREDAPSYGAVLHTLTTSPDDLVRHIAQQVHANAVVAQRKYRWANWSMRAVFVTLLALGGVAAVTAMQW